MFKWFWTIFSLGAPGQTPTIVLFVYDTFYDTFYKAIRVFSFHSCSLDQKFIIQRTHSCFTTFFLKSVFSSNVFCSWYGFPGCFTFLHIWSNYKYFDDLTGSSLVNTTSGGKYDIWSPFNGLPWFQRFWNLEAI